MSSRFGLDRASRTDPVFLVHQPERQSAIEQLIERIAGNVASPTRRTSILLTTSKQIRGAVEITGVTCDQIPHALRMER